MERLAALLPKNLREITCGLPRQPLGLEPLAVGGKCLCDLVIRYCLSGFGSAKCIYALLFGKRLGWFNLTRCF